MCALFLVPRPLTDAEWVLSENALNDAVGSTVNSGMWVPVPGHKLKTLFLPPTVLQIIATGTSLSVRAGRTHASVSEHESASNKDAR